MVYLMLGLASVLLPVKDRSLRTGRYSMRSGSFLETQDAPPGDDE